MDQPLRIVRSAEGDFDARDFRKALGTFATGVAILTTRNDQDKPVGLTCNSFNSVSLQPPLILWSLSTYSPSLAAFAQAEHFAVNVLAADQVELSRRFSQPIDNRFAGIATDAGTDGIPLIRGAAAHLECRNEARHYSGDHVIFIGRVLRYAYSNMPPLVFCHGAYMGLQDLPAAALKPCSAAATRTAQRARRRPS